MSVTIRLARIGRKNLPAYKIVVSNTRDKRNGRFVDIVGHFNPSANPQSFGYDKDKYNDWLKKGAQVSEAVEKLIEGDYEYKKYIPKHMEKKAEGAQPTESEPAPAESAPTSAEEPAA